MTCHILSYMTCSQCIDEKPAGVRPADWDRLHVGWTKRGLQVWCHRHQTNVIHIDFEGQKHPTVPDSVQDVTQ